MNILISLLCCLLSPWIIYWVGGKLVGKQPDCLCNGKDYFVEPAHLMTHPCGRWSMCTYDMHFYLTHMPDIPKSNLLGMKSAEEYGAVPGYILPKFGYPLDLSIEPYLMECRKGVRECWDEKNTLVRRECERFRHKKVGVWANLQDKGPFKNHSFYSGDPYKLDKNDFFLNGYRLMVDGRDGTMPVWRPKFHPLDTRFIWGACPYWILRPTYTMAVLLYEFAGVLFHEDLSVHELLSHLDAKVIRAMHCQIFSMRFDVTYLEYNHTQFCKEWHITSTYACIQLYDRPNDRENRTHEQCSPIPIPKNSYQQIDDADQLYAKGLVDSPRFLYPEDQDYPEVDFAPNHWTLPWFPPYRKPGQP